MFHHIHDIFHISFLEFYRTTEGRAPSPPSLIEVEDEEHAEVEEILDSRVYYGNVQYLIKWLGFPIIDNKWLKAEELGTAEEYVTDFYKKYPKKPSPDNLYREKRQRRKKRKR